MKRAPSTRLLRRTGILASHLVVLCACGHAEISRTSPARAPSATAPTSEHSAAREERIADYMPDHFIIVTHGRDSVILGELEALREPMRALAGHDYKDVASGGWMPWIAQLQMAAGLISEAGTLEAAASGVAAMARVCGECHAATSSGPYFGPSGRERTRPRSDTLDERMRRHVWAADRLWEGLTGPSDEAWNDGAAALALAPAAAPLTDPPMPPEVIAGLLETRALAADAADATSLAQRANVYGLLIATCANCHTHGVELDF